MIDALFSQTNYVATKKMLDATALRHEAIASNLANLETPGYKRIDVAPTFAAELERAVGENDAPAIAQVNPTLVTDRSAIAANRDGNTVQLETELMQLNQNTLAHTLETQLVTTELSRLRLAITGRS
jgi:flagellar basal-body rod protein FlgB